MYLLAAGRTGIKLSFGIHWSGAESEFLRLHTTTDPAIPLVVPTGF
jgi:hypothetical protein